MTEAEKKELVMAWKDYADKTKADKEWSETEEAEKEYQALLDKTFELTGV